ncbi:copper amine oxidase N-terminal domain-containing protein [Paenibacillus sp. NEAU-GSW1]|uniref:copper amine oxidase N-terminal domain-containing protein n=1 Tax=Paenibacillus sp. NEAU-GSW1 TaxID=2682486 RepID=UPI0012E0ED73|nr:copper amine oxidase N-terminal domain-containing protein [Paenibacillus sp. NEAU-GSW1]MUT64974.1 hypothetical protein [Paenibacillus sp. NEAU-GSW1]
MKRFNFSMLVLLIIALVVPNAVFAANEAGSAVEVRLKVGSPTVKINGSALTVQAPYEASGTTMVPLSVITKAFGATLKLQDNKIITLNYNQKKVVVTIGSKTVQVNDTNKTVAVAPVIVKGTTMVPVRVIVEAFGAAIGKDAATKEIVIKGTRASSSSSANNGGGINTDAGKTKVGDSYLGWSMNYPPGLALVGQNDDGTFVIWGDTKSGNSIVVWTMQNVGGLTSDEVREKIVDMFGTDEVVVDKRTIQVGDYSAEKVVSRSKSKNLMFEYRGILKDQTLYIVASGITGSERAVLDPYQALLDSFTPSFDKADKAVKDITKVVDGLLTFQDKDYGLTVKLPSGWYRDSDSNNPFFFSKDGVLEFSITSLAKDDTQEKWLARSKERVHNDFSPSYLRNETTSELTLQDGKAHVLSYEYSYDKKKWYHANEVFLVVGQYRYQLIFQYDTSLGAKGEVLFLQTMATVDIDIAFVEREFGLIEEEDETKTVTKKSNKYGYSIDLPAFWNGEETDFESEAIVYSNYLGFLVGQVYEDFTLSDFNYGIQEIIKKDSGNTLVSNTSITIGGSAGQKIVVQYADEDGTPTTDTLYFVEHKGNVIAFFFTYEDAHMSEATIKQLDAIVASVKLF